MSFRYFKLTVALAAVFFVQSTLAEPPGVGAGIQQLLPQTPFLRESGKSLQNDVSFTYYISLLGPSPGRGWGETYNVFRDDINGTPYQMLHAWNLGYRLNPRWSIGVTAAFVNDTSKKVRTGRGTIFGATPSENYQGYFYNRNEREWFNSRLYVNLPVTNFDWGYLTTTFAYELPTSNDSKPSADDPQNKLQYGLVLTNALGIYQSNSAFAFGISSQIIYYRYDKAEYDPFAGATTPTRKQTVLITVGPYANYMIADGWQIASKISIDWDKRGVQTLTEFNNNLPHWGRLALNRLFQNSYLGQIGIYSQFMLEDPSLARMAFGIDTTFRF